MEYISQECSGSSTELLSDTLSQSTSSESLCSWVSFPQITYDPKIRKVLVKEIIYAGEDYLSFFNFP